MCDFSEYGGKSADWLAVEASLPPPPVFADIYEQQKAINQGREEISSRDMKQLASSIRLADHDILARDGIILQARSYRPVDADANARLPVYIHLHGGGYLFGSLSSEDAISTRIALGTGAIVFNVNYRHTPDAVYPAAWNDAEDAFYWVHNHIDEIHGNPDQVLVGGISAGAQLAAALALKQNVCSPEILPCPRIAGQILMIPALVQSEHYQSQLEQLKDPSLSSYIENEYAPILSKKVIEFFTGLLKFPLSVSDDDDLRLNTGNATVSQVKGLPPTVLGICGLDPLRDEGLLYGKKLAEAG